MNPLPEFPMNGNLQTIGPALLFVNVSWCGHCTRARPVMEKVSGVLGSIVPVYSVDGDDRSDLTKALGVKSYPTILYITPGGAKYTYAEYTGDRTVDGIASFVCNFDRTRQFCRKFK